MRYSVVYAEDAVKQLKKIDRYTKTMSLSWISKHLEGTDNSSSSGKALTGDKAGLWMFRVGVYRLICAIYEGKLVTMLIDEGHRTNTYD